MVTRFLCMQSEVSLFGGSMMEIFTTYTTFEGLESYNEYYGVETQLDEDTVDNAPES